MSIKNICGDYVLIKTPDYTTRISVEERVGFISPTRSIMFMITFFSFSSCLAKYASCVIVESWVEKVGKEI